MLPLDEKIAVNRRLLGNPYAYLDGDGGYSANVLSLDRIRSPEVVGKNVSFKRIEEITKSLQNEIWKNRQLLWEEKTSDDLVALLVPAVAFEGLGYRFEVANSLGQIMSSNGMVDVAGFIDKSQMYAGVSSYFSKPIQNFTAAHELGHAVLHNAMGMHRDRDLNGGAVSGQLERVEIEANKFASCFLMPEKIVRVEFQKRFESDQFIVSEDTAFALMNSSQSALRSKYRNLRKLARKLAETGHYHSDRFFMPLNERFNVSTEAMAIRLEELQLIRY